MINWGKTDQNRDEPIEEYFYKLLYIVSDVEECGDWSVEENDPKHLT